MNIWPRILFLSILTFVSCYDILITNCKDVQSFQKDEHNLIISDCQEGFSSSSVSAKLTSPFALLAVCWICLFRMKAIPFMLVLFVAMSFVDVQASPNNSLNGFQILLDTSEKYFPDHFAADCTSNGIFTPSRFYWYYDSSNSYEYITYSTNSVGEVIFLKEYDGTQTHFVYLNSTDSYSLFPTNRPINPFVGEVYLLNLFDNNNGDLCYDVRREDHSTFSYCLNTENHLTLLQEGYDTFTFNSFNFVTDGGKYNSVAQRILSGNKKRSISDCNGGDEYNCCISVLQALHNLLNSEELGEETRSNAYCAELALQGEAHNMCASIAGNLFYCNTL